MGCGGGSTTEDMMMRAAKRSRGKPEVAEDDARTKALTAVSDNARPATPVASVPTAQVVSRSVVGRSVVGRSVVGRSVVGRSVTPENAESLVSDADGKGSTEEAVKLEELSIKPIAKRKPKAELSDEDRRRRAAENLKTIADAMEKYHADNGHYPAPASMSDAGIPTLSWRVELLPYLGHEELFKQFDFASPWNYEPNKTLLNYIPDVFVSPERFDTKTNFLLPAYRTFIFGSSRGRRKQDVQDEDGLANTIMLVEVNDELAVEWTRPLDYIPKDRLNMKMDLGKLRGEGAFAVWANGWTTLLANKLSNEQLINAFTYNSGDGQLAGTVHRDIPLADVSIAAGASDSESKLVKSTPADIVQKPNPMTELRTREAVPIAGDLAKAQSKLRAIFQTKIAEAKSDDKKAALANEMIELSKTMSEDAAGAFALQSAAMRLCSDAGELEPILQSVDLRVERFEVDAYEQNVSALLRFAESSTRRDPSELDGDAFLERAVPVIFAAIADDDYMRASSLARHAYRMMDQEPDEEMMRSLNRLRVLLSSAQREYDKAAASLANYHDDPSQADDAATFGRFLCFIKGDWETGLPLMIQGGPETLRNVAKRDLAGANDTINEVAIGDDWWRLSEGIRNGVYRQAIQDRAAYWYQNAYPVMPDSLDKIHVKNRLDELGSSNATSPLALIRQLADDVGINLGVSLASVASVGRTTSYNPDDD